MPARPRPRSRARLLASSLALLVPTALLTWSAPGAAGDEAAEVPPSVSVRSVGGQKIRLEALPQVVQFGGQVADPDHASAAVTATVRPVRVGRRVQLQVRSGDAWELVATRRQDARGRAQFAAPGVVDGEAVSYRVRAIAYGGLRARTSYAGEHRPLARADVDRRVLRDRARPAVEHARPRARDRQPPVVLQGRPARRQRGGGALRLSVVEDPEPRARCRITRTRRDLRAATPTASTATSARRASSPSGTASRPHG